MFVTIHRNCSSEKEEQRLLKESTKYSLPKHILYMNQDMFAMLSEVLLSCESEYVLVCDEHVCLPENIEQRVHEAIEKANVNFGHENWGIIGNSGLEFFSGIRKEWVKKSETSLMPSLSASPVPVSSFDGDCFVLNIKTLREKGITCPMDAKGSYLYTLILLAECYKSGLICLVDSSLFIFSQKKNREEKHFAESASQEWFQCYWKHNFINHRVETVNGVVEISQETTYLKRDAKDKRVDFLKMIERVVLENVKRMQNKKTVIVLVRTMLNRIHTLRRCLDTVRMMNNISSGAVAFQVHLSINGVDVSKARKQSSLLQDEYADISLKSIISPKRKVDGYYPRVNAIRAILESDTSEKDMFVWIVDDDDFVMAPSAKYLAVFLNDKEVFAGNSIVFDEVWDEDVSIPSQSRVMRTFDGSLYPKCFLGGNVVPVCSVIYPLHVLKEIFAEHTLKGDYNEDYTLFLFAMSRYDIRHVPLVIAGISYHGKNTVLEENKTHWDYSYATFLSEVTQSGVFRNWQAGLVQMHLDEIAVLEHKNWALQNDIDQRNARDLRAEMKKMSMKKNIAAGIHHATILKNKVMFIVFSPKKFFKKYFR